MVKFLSQVHSHPSSASACSAESCPVWAATLRCAAKACCKNLHIYHVMMLLAALTSHQQSETCYMYKLHDIYIYIYSQVLWLLASFPSSFWEAHRKKSKLQLDGAEYWLCVSVRQKLSARCYKQTHKKRQTTENRMLRTSKFQSQHIPTVSWWELTGALFCNNSKQIICS